VPAHLCAPPGRAEEVAGDVGEGTGPRAGRAEGDVSRPGPAEEAEGVGELDERGDSDSAGKCAPAGTSVSSWEELLGSGWFIRGGWFPTGCSRPPNTAMKIAR
jgi:hypothetical protein